MQCHLLKCCFGCRQPNIEDIVNIVHRMYEKDGISRDEVVSIVNTFPNQGIFLLVYYWNSLLMDGTCNEQDHLKVTKEHCRMIS